MYGYFSKSTKGEWQNLKTDVEMVRREGTLLSGQGLPRLVRWGLVRGPPSCTCLVWPLGLETAVNFRMEDRSKR